MADAEATLEAPQDDPGTEPVPAEPATQAPAASRAATKVKEPRKPRKGKATDEEAPAGDGPSVAGHPRAARAVARAKSWGALGGFLLGGYLSLPTNTVASAGLRAIVAGLVCYVAAWAGAVFFWRRMGCWWSPTFANIRISRARGFTCMRRGLCSWRRRQCVRWMRVSWACWPCSASGSGGRWSTANCERLPTWPRW